MTVLLVALGGALGAMARFVIDGEVKMRFPRWLISTFLINVSGSLLLGAVAALGPTPGVQGFVMTGLCGGFTTFSTASVETVALLRPRPRYAIAYALGTLVCCVLTVRLGAAMAG